MATRRDDGRLEVGRRPGVCHMLVSRDQARPAVLILQAVCKEAERHGYSIVPVERESYGPSAGVAIDIRGHRYAIEVAELTDRVPLTSGELADCPSPTVIRTSSRIGRVAAAAPPLGLA